SGKYLSWVVSEWDTPASIRSLDLENGGLAMLVTESDCRIFGYAADERAVYWTCFPGGPGELQVKTMPIAGGPVSILASVQHGDDFAKIVVGESDVYWTDDFGVMKVAKSGGDPEMLAGDDGAAGSLALDAGRLFFIGG